MLYGNPYNTHCFFVSIQQTSLLNQSRGQKTEELSPKKIIDQVSNAIRHKRVFYFIVDSYRI